MKNKFIKSLLLLTLTLVFFSRCVSEDEFDIPNLGEAVMKEDFQTAVDNTNLDIPNWTNVATEGTKVWKEEAYLSNGYAEFSAFSSGSISNIAWLISPELDLDVYQKDGVSFKVAQHHLDVDSPDNTLQVLISNDFDGTNVTTANWTVLNANIPTNANDWYAFLSSNIDLSGYTGKVHIAFKFIGSGTDDTLDGAFQVDDFIFYEQAN